MRASAGSAPPTPGESGLVAKRGPRGDSPTMDPAFAAHTKILERRKKPKKAKPEKAIPTAGRDLNERALSKAAAAAREPGAPEPDEEEGDWYTTAVAIEASAQSGSSRRLHKPSRDGAPASGPAQAALGCDATLHG